MRCHRCGHENISEFRFCEVCLAPLRATTGPIGRSERPDDVVGRFFADADLLEQGAGDTSKGTVATQRFELPWRPSGEGQLLVFARERDLRHVAEHAIAALRERRMAALTVQGEQGSGRSTLLAALRDRAPTEVPGARAIATSAQGCHRAYALVERIVRLRFDIGEFLAGTIAGERFERTVEAFYADPAGAEVARTCGPMLGFQFWNDHDIDFLDRAEQTRRAREALFNLLHRMFAEPPTLLVVDDAGDADAESLDVIAQLLIDAPELPLAVVLSADRRGVVRRPWLGERPILELGVLSVEVLADLARRALAGVDGVTAEMIAALAAHANGRPGWVLASIEALARRGAITAQGGRWVAAPTQVAAALESSDLFAQSGGRLDHLDDFQMQVVLAAAVFGVHFWTGGATALLRIDTTPKGGKGARTVDELGRDKLPERIAAAVQALVDRGVFVAERQGLLPAEGPHRFADEADRQSVIELHEPTALARLSQQAAVWLQMVAGERAGDLSSVLAPLWLVAGDRVHAAHVYLRAGHAAHDAYRHADALHCFERARELAPEDLTHVHCEALLGLGRLYEADGAWADAEARYRDALELAWRFRARARGARALQHIGRMLRTQGKVVAAIDHLAPALRLYEGAHDLKGLASACDDIGRAYLTVGRLDPAQQFLKRAAQYREKMGDRNGQAHTLCNLGVVLLTRGRLEQAQRYLERAAELQRERKNLHGLGDALNALGVVHVAAGAHDAAMATMEEAMALARRVGNRRTIAMMQNNLGEVLGLVGRGEEGEALLYQAVEGAGRLGDHAVLADASRNLAVAARGRSDKDRALKWARRSVAAAAASDVLRTRAFAHKTLAEVLGDAGDSDGACEAWQRAAEWFTRASETRELESCLQAHAAYLVGIGRPEQAASLLARVERIEAGALA